MNTYHYVVLVEAPKVTEADGLVRHLSDLGIGIDGSKVEGWFLPVDPLPLDRLERIQSSHPEGEVRP